MKTLLLFLLACVETIPQGSSDGRMLEAKDRGRKARYSPIRLERVAQRSQNFFKSNPAWFRFKRKGMRYQGGQQIEAPVFFDKLIAGGSFEDRDSLNITNNTVATSAVYKLREYHTAVSVSDRDMAINAGRAAILSFAKQKINHAKDNIADVLGADLQGSNSDGKSLEGFGLVMSTSSTMGNIAPADMVTWKANILAAGANTMTLARLQTVLGQCTFGASRPTIIYSNQACYDKFSTFGDTAQRIIDTDMASVGIAQLNFRGIPWVVDSHVAGSGGGVTDNIVEFVNEDYLEIWTSSDYDFKVEQLSRIPGEAVQRWEIWWKGNLVTHSRRHQGELTSIDTNL